HRPRRPAAVGSAGTPGGARGPSGIPPPEYGYVSSAGDLFLAPPIDRPGHQDRADRADDWSGQLPPRPPRSCRGLPVSQELANPFGFGVVFVYSLTTSVRPPGSRRVGQRLASGGPHRCLGAGRTGPWSRCRGGGWCKQSDGVGVAIRHVTIKIFLSSS